MSPLRSALGLLVALLMCFAAAGIGSSVTAPSIQTWYVNLSKPAGTPPNWVFGPVWTALYAMMAVAVWRVWRRAGVVRARVALGLFAIQLLLNVLWSILFFGLLRPDWALIDIALLWVAILACGLASLPHDRVAAALLLPYLLWVTYAAYLNGGIWLLNR